MNSQEKTSFFSFLKKKTAESECLRLFYLLNDCHLYKADDTLLRLGGLCMLGLLYHVLTAKFLSCNSASCWRI